jgi:hypothetical protein
MMMVLILRLQSRPLRIKPKMKLNQVNQCFAVFAVKDCMMWIMILKWKAKVDPDPIKDKGPQILWMGGGQWTHPSLLKL